MVRHVAHARLKQSEGKPSHATSALEKAYVNHVPVLADLLEALASEER